MPFRQRIKKAFGRSNSQSDSGSSGTSSSRKDSSVYQPGEAMPLPKYRGFVDPKHKAKLEKFSFGTSEWRRRSTNSVYSPMGSKLPSRNNSTKGPLGQEQLFGQVQGNSDEHDDISNIGGTRIHSISADKGTNEHCEYAADAKALNKPQATA